MFIALLTASAFAVPGPAAAFGDWQTPEYREAPGRLAVVYWWYFDAVGTLVPSGQGLRPPSPAPDRPPPGRVIVLSTPETLCRTCRYHARGERQEEGSGDIVDGHPIQAFWLPLVPRVPGLPGFFPDWWPLPRCDGEPPLPVTPGLASLETGPVQVFLPESSDPSNIDHTELEP